MIVLAAFRRRGGGDFRLDRADAVLDADLQVTVAVLQVALRPTLLQHDLAGGPEDLVVHGDHDGQRYVERAQRRVYLVTEVLAHGAVRYTVHRRVLVAQYEHRRKANARRAQPHQRHAHQHPAGRPLHAVLQRLGDGVVPVHADHAQVQYGRGAGQHVERHLWGKRIVMSLLILLLRCVVVFKILLNLSFVRDHPTSASGEFFHFPR